MIPIPCLRTPRVGDGLMLQEISGDLFHKIDDILWNEVTPKLADGLRRNIEGQILEQLGAK